VDYTRDLESNPAMDQKRNLRRFLRRFFAEVLATNRILKATMVLAIALARVFAMDRMLEDHMFEIAKALVMVIWMAPATDQKILKSLATLSAPVLATSRQ